MESKHHNIAINKTDDYDDHGLEKPLLNNDKHVDAVPSLPTYYKDTSRLKQGSSCARTCFNMMNTISGIGVLSMPYALATGGWLSLAIFVMVAVICYYTGLLIQRCMAFDENIKTFADIGQYAFGSKGKMFVSIFMYVELYLVAVSFLILEGDNLNNLFPNTSLNVGSFSIQGNKLFIFLSALVILPTTWLRSLGMLAYVSAGGVLASAVLLCSLLWAGISDVGFSQKGTLFNFEGLPTALGLFFVCFTCHAVFPTIHSSMKEAKHFSKVLSISFFLCTLNYGLMAVLGYLMFGEDLQSQVTLNFSSGKLYSRIAIYTTLINPFTKFALTISPIAMAIEDRLAVCKGKTSASFLVRTLLLGSTVLVASTIPFFAYLMAFIGSFLSITVSVLFPCLCYLKIFGTSNLSRFELANVIFILLVGCLAAISGTYTSLRDIIHNL